MDDARPGIAIDATRDQRREPVEHDERAADAEVAARGHLDVTRVDPHARQPEEPVGDDQAEQPRPEAPVPGAQHGRRDPGRAPAQPEAGLPDTERHRDQTERRVRPERGPQQRAHARQKRAPSSRTVAARASAPTWGNTISRSTPAASASPTSSSVIGSKVVSEISNGSSARPSSARSRRSSSITDRVGATVRARTDETLPSSAALRS